MPHADPRRRAEYRRAWESRNPEKVLARRLRYKQTRPSRAGMVLSDEQRARKNVLNRRYKARHRGAERERRRLYRERNRERIRAAGREYFQRARSAYYARYGQYRAKLKQATPVWANWFFIREAYELAALRSEVTGIRWSVDHVVPLQSPLVCGLHTEQNLEVVPLVSNIAKSNRIWRDMP
jgi:hypothetical protein